MKKIYLVGNSHIDPVWLWDYREGIDEVISTFQSACDRLEEYPEMHFTASSAQYYRWVEKFAPELFKRIKKHVTKGRWEIAGGWWIEPDCILPIEQSFQMQIKIGKSYIRDRFGLDVSIGYNPDSFGHSAALPKILAENGYKYYLFCRPGATENHNIPEDLFYWEYEGSRVLCYRLPYHYTVGRDMEAFRKNLNAALENSDFLKRNSACYFYGVGNHGGGPTIAEIEYLLQKKKEAKRHNIELVFSTLQEFFTEAETSPDIPVISGDLHMHAVGCYSVIREIKEAVRNAEYSALTAERALKMASVADNAGIRQEVKSAWQAILFNEFHDILPGSCTKNAADEAVRQLAGARTMFDNLTYENLKKLSAKVPIRNREGGYVLWNTLPWNVKAVFETETIFNIFSDSLSPDCNQYCLKDRNGRIIPYQVIPGATATMNLRRLIIDEIPARSCNVYYLSLKDKSGNYPLKTESGTEIENNQYRIKTGENGLPTLISLQKSGEGAICSPVRLLVLNDRSDTWGHYARSYDEVVGEFTIEGEPVIVSGGYLTSIITHLIYRGGGKRIVDPGHSFFEPDSISRATVETRIYSQLPYVEFRINILWNKPRSILKMEIPFIPGSAGKLIAQVPGGKTERVMDGAEEPLQGWIKLENSLHPAFCQKGAYAYDCENSRLRITLVRSSHYGYNIGPKPLDYRLPQYHTDLGEHRFTGRLYLGKAMDEELLNRIMFEMYEPFLLIREPRRKKEDE